MKTLARAFALLLAAGVCAAQQAAAEVPTLERAVNSAYENALRTIGAAGRAALKRDHAAFQRARVEAGKSGDLAIRLSIRLDFLQRIQEARSDWLGSWANAFATVAIEPRGGPNYHIRITAADPVSGRWTCEFDDTAILHRGVMIVGAESAADIAGGPNEGWTLALRLAGDILLVEPLRPRGHTGAMPFCGAGGNVAGNYFHQDDTLVQHSAGKQREP